MIIFTKTPILASALLCSIFVSGCNNDSLAKAKDLTATPRPAVLVETWEAKNTEITENIQSTGTLIGNESVTITATVTDQISDIYFEDGQYVNKGQILVRLESTEQSAELEEAEANLSDSKIILARLESLGQKIATASGIDEAKARVNANQGRFNAIQSRIKDRVIRAPFDGVLGFRKVSSGALITPGTIITELDDISQLKLDFNVPETYLSKINIGNTVTSTSLAWPGMKFQSTVSHIDNRVDPVTRTITLRTIINNKDRKLHPGMFLNVTLESAKRDALVIPEQALIQVDESSHVFIVNDQLKALKQPVSIGARVNGAVEIRNGIQQGDQVVINGQFNLRPMANVKIVEKNGVKQTAMNEH
ncbi:efflux RND transporter periplasmic adaptor subunit [Aestuariicella hydrocarbonica]|uniref:Efflux RND transporter periplasmic adaptor subunit n=1 Tax=Pseudomaricurvus hydrocarbonicus TaxID=1470433 RepID=A0A9E5MK67_9GAMM|nr:efflux RND transporter periplasmic adaptor subunit [Aestuariicella hydrocarbonica]NHO64972.1 efflux RND transporter periplasmic adaptor subunit [Aestuariicella hydrocarbonica]